MRPNHFCNMSASDPEQLPLVNDRHSSEPGVQPQPQNAVNADEERRRTQANIFNGVQNLADTSPGFFYLWVIWMILEIMATITILIMYWSKPCDRKLKVWVLVHTCRYIISFPAIYFRYLNRGADASSPVMVSTKQILDTISLFVFAWWITGQVWVFGAETCQRTASGLWIYALVIIILLYLAYCFPFVLIMLVCSALPIVLAFMRLFGVGRGASKALINQLQTSTFSLAKAKQAARQDETQFSCSVCMEDYKEGEKLMTLPCRHTFHRKCIRGWLPISRTCPSCRADIQQQPNANQDQDQEELV